MHHSRVFDVASFRRNYLRPALRPTDVPEMRFYDLRHTWSPLMLSVGRQPYEACRWMGHASLVTADTICSPLCVTDYDRDRDAITARLEAQR